MNARFQHILVVDDQHRINRHDQQFDQVVLNLPRLSRVRDRCKYVRQTQLAFRLHGGSQNDRHEGMTHDDG